MHYDEEYSVGKQPCQKIAEPIQFMRKLAEAEGGKLDGRWAVELSDSANYLKEIARRALAEAPKL